MKNGPKNTHIPYDPSTWMGMVRVFFMKNQDWNLGPGRRRPTLNQEIFCNLPQFHPQLSQFPRLHSQVRQHLQSIGHLRFLARWLRKRPHLDSKNSKLLEISPSCWPRHVPDRKLAIVTVTIDSRNISLSISQCYIYIYISVETPVKHSILGDMHDKRITNDEMTGVQSPGWQLVQIICNR